MNILITGGTGFIGGELTRTLLSAGHSLTVLSRDPEKVKKIFGEQVRPLNDLDQTNLADRFDCIINLAGAPIFDSPWTEARKKIIWDSRVGLTDKLVTTIAKLQIKPELLISGSAIGYYGDQGDVELTENSSALDDFPHRLCEAWENSAKQAEKLGVRVCLIRTGLVIAGDGGILAKMLLPFKLGLGGQTGNGRQWMSWIHRSDWIKIALTLIEDKSLSGAFNATAPNPVTNKEFTKTLAAILKRPAVFNVPAPLLKLMLGEMSELILGSQRVLPNKLLAHGFKFEYPSLTDALKEALSK